MAAVIIGLDAGTSVIKAVAFDPHGRQLCAASTANVVRATPDGLAEQDMGEVWQRSASVLSDLLAENHDIAKDVAAIAVTGQGDGSWFVEADGEPVGPATIWMDGRARGLVADIRLRPEGEELFRITGSGLNPSMQSSQLMWFAKFAPERLARVHKALHCKDWLYYCLSGEMRTDASEGCYTFGNWKTGRYDPAVLKLVGLEKYARLLPEFSDYWTVTGKVTIAASRLTGLKQGLPVVHGPVDMVTGSLGVGAYDPDIDAGGSLLGSAGVHAKVVPLDQVFLGERQGYTMPFIIEGTRLQLMTHMAASLNIDWAAKLAGDVAGAMGAGIPEKPQILAALEKLAADADPARLLYGPFISGNGERMPFFAPHASAHLAGFNLTCGFGDVMRAVYEGIAFMARDCFDAMGGMPREIRASGGSLNSRLFRTILASVLGQPLRLSGQTEAGAAGAAMTAAVALKFYETVPDACHDWVGPRLGALIEPDPELAPVYAEAYPVYRKVYESLRDVWPDIARLHS